MFRFVSFLGQQCRELVDSSGLKQSLHETYQYDLEKGVQPHQLFKEDQHLQHLKQTEHLVCFSTRQSKYLLFCTRIDQKQYNFMINPQTGSFILVRYHFDPSIYKGTLFEGEIMTDQEGQQLYLVSDLILYEGTNVTRISLADRLRMIRTVLQEFYSRDRGQEICRLELREYVSYEHLRDFVRQRNRVVSYSEHISGLLFKPLQGGQCIVVVMDKANFHHFPLERDRRRGIPQGLKREKFRTDGKKEHPQKPPIAPETPSEMRFLVKSTEHADVYNLYLRSPDPHKTTLVHYGVACVPSIQTSRLLRDKFTGKNDLTFVCRFHSRFHSWEPLRLVDGLP